MNRGEIWLVDLDPTIGAEMNKTRPALIMSDNRLGKLPFIIRRHVEPLVRKHKFIYSVNSMFSGESFFNFADTIFIVSCHFICVGNLYLRQMIHGPVTLRYRLKNGDWGIGIREWGSLLESVA
jgi:mRNA interferase MazF